MIVNVRVQTQIGKRVGSSVQFGHIVSLKLRPVQLSMQSWSWGVAEQLSGPGSTGASTGGFTGGSTGADATGGSTGGSSGAEGKD